MQYEKMQRPAKYLRKPVPQAFFTQAPSIPNSVMLSLLQYQKEDAAAKQPNKTGLPDVLKERFEKQFGLSLDDVRVHRNSDKPADLGALAYAQGNEIHLGPGQEKHLEHELGHVVQQKAGLVRPNGNINGQPINYDENLEAKASTPTLCGNVSDDTLHNCHSSNAPCIQGAFSPKLFPKKELAIVTKRFKNDYKAYKKREKEGAKKASHLESDNNVDKKLFTTGNYDFASKSNGKFGSIYFSDKNSKIGGRIRLTHSNGPQVSKHEVVERYILSKKEYEEYKEWKQEKKKAKISPSLKQTRKKIVSLGGKDAPSENIKENGNSRLIEIWPNPNVGKKKPGEHPSRGGPAPLQSKSNKQIKLKQKDIDYLRFAAQYAQDLLLNRKVGIENEPGDEKEKAKLHADIKNEFSRKAISKNKRLKKLPIDMEMRYKLPNKKQGGK
ncbi:DUF4157 domain-containing protein [Christensenellaceae bacterium OttesenSCG-928-L17]|nr:DUF4157 domain-containing protein [Christensenellaceae bacterium OttesenSCG-928-L17]